MQYISQEIFKSYPHGSRKQKNNATLKHLSAFGSAWTYKYHKFQSSFYGFLVLKGMPTLLWNITRVISAIPKFHE